MQKKYDLRSFFVLKMTNKEINGILYCTPLLLTCSERARYTRCPFGYDFHLKQLEPDALTLQDLYIEKEQLMKKKHDYDTYQSNLRFDNLNFKLAVLQHLIFEKKVFSPNYDFGDFEEMYYQEDLSMEECDEAVEQYVQHALQYFTYLNVPADLAKHVTELQIDAGDDIYYEINPEWCGEDGMFDVDKISDREISQFPKLKRISFWYMSNNVEELKKQLKAHKVKVELGAKEIGRGNRTRVSLVAACLCLIIATMGVGGISGKLFLNRYQDYEVIWSTSPAESDEKTELDEITESMGTTSTDKSTQSENEDAKSEEESSQADYDYDQALNESYEKSQKELMEELKKVIDKMEGAQTYE